MGAVALKAPSPFILALAVTTAAPMYERLVFEDNLVCAITRVEIHPCQYHVCTYGCLAGRTHLPRLEGSIGHTDSALVVGILNPETKCNSPLLHSETQVKAHEDCV